MGLPGHGTLARHQGRDATIWDLEWTFSNGTGTPVLDTTQSSQDTRVVTPVADGGAGITTVNFPKARRAWLAYLAYEPADETTAADYRQAFLVSLNAAAGTCEIRYLAANGGALSDPATGARVRLGLRLEYT